MGEGVRRWQLAAVALAAALATALAAPAASEAQTPAPASSAPAPAKKKKAPPPSLVDENLARIGAAGSEETGWALLGVGTLLGAALFTARNLSPRRLQLGKPSAGTVQRVTAVAHRALELHAKQQRGLSADEVADLQAFYERWLNLGPDQREYFRDALKREGIDVAKIGDAIRFAIAARA